MACKDKISNTCPEKTFAVCVKYETDLPTWSEITDCPNLELTTEELYTQVSTIKDQIDLSALGTKCLTYVLDADGKKIVKNVLLKYEQEICDLKDRVTVLETTAFCDMNITDCGIDFKCLLPNICDTSIVKVKDLFQSIINKICP